MICVVSCTQFINNHLIRLLWVDILKIEFQSSAFKAADHLLRTLIIDEAVIVCIYVEISECLVNALVGDS